MRLSKMLIDMKLSLILFCLMNRHLLNFVFILKSFNLYAFSLNFVYCSDYYGKTSWWSKQERSTGRVGRGLNLYSHHIMSSLLSYQCMIHLLWAWFLSFLFFWLYFLVKRMTQQNFDNFGTVCICHLYYTCLGWCQKL